jgi:uncharacterized Zn finger protein (UPF0148 family)
MEYICVCGYEMVIDGKDGKLFCANCGKIGLRVV